MIDLFKLAQAMSREAIESKDKELWALAMSYLWRSRWTCKQ